MSTERRLAVALVVVTVAVALLIALAPRRHPDCSGPHTFGNCPITTERLVQRVPAIGVALAITVVLAAAAAAIGDRRFRMVVAGLLSALFLVGLLSIGPLFVPTVGLAWALASSTRQARQD